MKALSYSQDAEQEQPAGENEVERLRSENEGLRQELSEARLHLELATDGYWNWDLKNPDYEYMSPGFWRNFGYDPASKPHSPEAWKDLIHPDDRREAETLFSKHLADGTPYNLQVRYRHANGHWAWVVCRGHAIRDSSGDTFVRMLGAHQDITQVKAAEESLQVFESFFEHSPVPLHLLKVVDPNDRMATVYLRANRAGRASMPDDAKFGISLRDGYPELEETQIPDAYLRACSSGEIQDLGRFPVVEQDRVFRIRVFPLGGPFVGLSAEDVTEFEQATKLAQRSEERFRAIYEHAPIMIDAFSEEGVCQLWNRECEERLGYSLEEIRELEDPLEVFYPEQENRERVIRSIAASDGTFEEYQVRARNGEKRVQRWANFRLPNGEGIAVGYDLTAERAYQRAAEAAKAKATADLEALALRHKLSLRASNIGVWDWDVVNDHLVWDDSMYQLYGMKREGWTSAYEAWVAGLHPEDREASEKAIERALAGEGEFDTEFRVVWPNDEVRYIRAIAETVRDESGAATRMVGVNWDITDERLRLMELERANTELEQFAYFASHDLQAPIRHLSSFVKLLEEHYADKFDDEGKQWLGFISEGSAHMHRLIRDLLSYTRAGKTTLVTEQTELSLLVERVLRVLNHDSLVVKWDSLPTLWGNPVQLEQLFQNLLENAIRYAKPGEDPRVEITAHETRTHWVVEVQDHGIGIAEEYHQHIFEPFHRLTPKDSTGSGIGLAICTKVVQRHGGTIRVDSRPDEGATFTITISKHAGSRETFEGLHRGVLVDGSG